MEWERRFLETLHASRPAEDEPPDWRAALPFYDAQPDERRLLSMMEMPEELEPDRLLCMEAAVLVAAERQVGAALFAFNRLMRAPRWHACFPRLHWLNKEGHAAQRALMETQAGRYLGAMLGLACADALGETRSDHTAMALAVARGIIESPDDPVEAVGSHFQAWNAGHSPHVRSAENGALIRTLPAALAYGPDPTHAIRIARMTHPHPDSDAAVAVYQVMVDGLLQGASRHDACHAALAAAGPLRERLVRTPALSEGEVRSTGYIADTLEAAIWCFLGTANLEDCIAKAVALGDDTRMVGAVAGGLAGAFYGAAAIPRRWSLALKHRSELEATAENLYLTANRT